MSKQHAIRTCHFCGVRAPQPEMIRDEVHVESGQSKSSITGATIIGAAAGSRSAKRAIERTIFGSVNRKYVRRREIWRCDADGCRSAAEEAGRQSKRELGLPVWIGIVLVVGAFIIYAALAGGKP